MTYLFRCIFTSLLRRPAGAALAITILWLIGCAWYISANIGWASFGAFLPHEIGAFCAGVFAPRPYAGIQPSRRVNWVPAQGRGDTGGWGECRGRILPDRQPGAIERTCKTSDARQTPLDSRAPDMAKPRPCTL